MKYWAAATAPSTVRWSASAGRRGSGVARAVSRRARSSGPRAATASAASLDSGGGVRLAAEAVAVAGADASAAEGDAPA